MDYGESGGGESKRNRVKVYFIRGIANVTYKLELI